MILFIIWFYYIYIIYIYLKDIEKASDVFIVSLECDVMIGMDNAFKWH